MNKNIRDCLPYIERLRSFRNNIPAKLSKGKVKEVWDVKVMGKKYEEIDKKEGNIIDKKVLVAKRSLQWMTYRSWVRFIGISGSVGSEFAKSKDDIDLFVVTKNDTIWIYRLYLYLMNLSKKQIRSRGDINNVKDKLCINLLIEERNLTFDKDVFNLNELLYLKAIYNKDFLSVIFLQNSWLERDFLVSEKFLNKESIQIGMLKNLTKRNYLLWTLNLICFLGQFIFMLIMGHSPDLERLFVGFKRGKIEFYRKDFKKEKLEKLDS